MSVEDVQNECKVNTRCTRKNLKWIEDIQEQMPVEDLQKECLVNLLYTERMSGK